MALMAPSHVNSVHMYTISAPSMFSECGVFPVCAMSGRLPNGARLAARKRRPPQFPTPPRHVSTAACPICDVVSCAGNCYRCPPFLIRDDTQLFALLPKWAEPKSESGSECGLGRRGIRTSIGAAWSVAPSTSQVRGRPGRTRHGGPNT